MVASWQWGSFFGQLGAWRDGQMIHRLIVMTAAAVPVACNSVASDPPGPTGVMAGKSEAVQLAWVDSLGAIAKHRPQLSSHLVAALVDSNPKVQLQAAFWLGEMGPRATRPLIDALSDSRPSVRSAAAFGLGHIGREAGPAAVWGLTKVLAGVDDSAAAMANWAIDEIGPGRLGVMGASLRAYRFGVGPPRYEALISLRLLGPAATPAIPLLISAIESSDRVAARLAADALIGIGPLAIPAVEAAMRRGSQRVRVTGRRVLEALHRSF